MENRGKVNKLVKKFNNKPIMKKEPPGSVRKQSALKQQIDKTEIEQDEISVTIDIGEDENPIESKPLVKTRSKKNIPIKSESEAPKSDDHLNTPNPERQVKEINKNEASRLSPWLSKKLNNNVPELQNIKYKSVATDTLELKRRQDEEIRLMNERIDDLECQSKIKDREIETLKWIENEMQRRLQTTGDHLTLKQKAKEIERKLEMQEKLNEDLSNDNLRLYDELSGKDRKILELQSEVNNLDKIIANKEFICESEFSQQMISKVDEIQKELMEKEIKLKENEQNINELLREIERKNVELNIKTIKLEEATDEAGRQEYDYIAQERNRYTLMESLKSKERENEILSQQLRKVNELEKKWKTLEDENLFLKQSLHDVEDQCNDLERRHDTRNNVESVVDELHDLMLEKNKLNEENTYLSQQLSAAESIIREKTMEEVSLQKENSQLKTFIIDLEEEIGLYRKFEMESNELDAQLRESERDRNALENQIVEMKPQIQKYQIKSQEKDHLIMQLVQELKSQAGYLPTDLRKEIIKNDIKENMDNIS